MAIETFECVETVAEPIEAAEEAVEIINRLNLEGQRSLIRTDEKSGRDSRSPYRLITADEFFVYRTICPQRTKLQEYDEGPIPLRVLQIAAHAAEIGLGPHMHVWHRASVQVKDPVLVATTLDYISDWNDSFGSGKTWILARWGEELETFATLLKSATEIARERLRFNARGIVAQIEGLSAEEIVKFGHLSKVGIGT